MCMFVQTFFVVLLLFFFLHFWTSFLSSGIPLQLDRFLPVLLSDHLCCWTIRCHLRLRPVPHQVDPYSAGASPNIKTELTNRTGVEPLQPTFKLTEYFCWHSSFPHTSPVTLMDSTGCGGCSWCWVSNSTRFNKENEWLNRDWCDSLCPSVLMCVLFWTQVWVLGDGVVTSHMVLLPSPGFLLFFRGFINYARIRKMADTFATLPRTRVLFIYWAPRLSVFSLSLSFPLLRYAYSQALLNQKQDNMSFLSLLDHEVDSRAVCAASVYFSEMLRIL